MYSTFLNNTREPLMVFQKHLLTPFLHPKVFFLCIVFIIHVLFAAITCAENQDTFPENSWVPIDWKVQIKPGALPKGVDPASSEQRTVHWYGGITYHPGKGEVLVMDGYFKGQMGGPSIYANALFGMNAASKEYTLYKAANYSGGSTPRPELKNNWTPAPRHTYDFWTYASSTNSVYMIYGANKYVGYAAKEKTKKKIKQYCPDPWVNTDGTKQLGFWRYDFNDHKWHSLHDTNLPSIPGYEGSLIYVPEQERIYLFPMAKKRIYSFDLKTEKWRSEGIRLPWNRYRGATFLDTKRDRVVFYSGKEEDKDTACDLGVFDLKTKKFSILPVSGPKPPAPRKDGGIAYNSKHDLYVAWGGTGKDDNWVFNPQTNSWKALQPVSNIPTAKEHSSHVDMIYDSKHDLLIVTRAKGDPGDWFAMRFNPRTANYSNTSTEKAETTEYTKKNGLSHSKISNKPSLPPAPRYKALFRSGKSSLPQAPKYKDSFQSGNSSLPPAPQYKGFLQSSHSSLPPAPRYRHVSYKSSYRSASNPAPRPSTKTPSLPVPLEVHNWAKVDRHGEPVTAGLPLPAEAVYDLSRLRLVDKKGKPVSAQFRSLSKWWYEKHSKKRNPSHKWVLLDFQADVPAKGISYFRLEKTESQALPSTRLHIFDRKGEVTVDTGKLKFRVSKNSGNMFDGVWLDINGDHTYDRHEAVILPNNNSEGRIIAGDWPKGGCIEGTVHSTLHSAPERVLVEEQGPMKVTLRVEGRHFAKHDGVKQGLYGYRMFITAYAGKPHIDLQYALTNTDIEGERPIKTRDVLYKGAKPYTINSWPFLAYDLDFKLNLNNEKTYTVLTAHERKGDLSDASVDLFQEHGRFALKEAGTVIGNGQDAPGTAAVSDGRLGLAVAMRDFAPNYPKGLSLKKNSFTIKLFPETEKVYWLDHHTRKNHRMRLTFFKHHLQDGELEALWEQNESPLRMLAPATWYRDTRAWDGGFAIAPGYKRKTPFQWKRKAKSSRGEHTGWADYGFINKFNGGGHHWNLATVFGRYLMDASPKRFEKNESRVFYFNNMVPVHTSYTRWKDFNWMLQPEEHLNDYSIHHPLDLETSKRKFPEWKPNRVKNNKPDHGHMTNFQQLEYYYLTGDWATYDSLLDEGLRAAACIYWRVYGTYGGWSYKDHDAPVDLDQFLELGHGSRYIARPLYVALQAYQITGDNRYLYPATIYACNLRNVVWKNPIGFLGEPYHPKDPGYAKNWINRWKSKYPDRPVPQSSTNSLFQAAIANRALYKYWQETHDEAIRDALLLSTLSFERVAHIDKGRYQGWPYTWSDYLSEGKRSASGDYTGSSGESLTGLVYGYLISGRQDLYRVIQDAHRKHGGSWWDPRVLCHFEAVQRHQGRDITPPETVRDLQVNVISPDSVKLTWTAPGDDGLEGTAGSYQLKYSRGAPITDQVEHWNSAEQTGWPDMRKPLPLSRSAYYKKATLFLNNREKSFWAAENVDGEPAPGKPGSQESMVISGLEPGVYSFAMVTWDNFKAEYKNVSKLSNIVKVDIGP